ncbi:Uncharacterised protein [Escherichia coli]|nr:Uncharacterised protein [Escherichia coli]CTZ98557.1 Uncharacterised protein [Escherichia coli]
MIPGGPFTFPQCLFSGLNQGRQQFSRDGHLAVFAHVIDDLHHRSGRNTGLNPLFFRDVLQACQDGPDFMTGQRNFHTVSQCLNSINVSHSEEGQSTFWFQKALHHRELR